MILKPPITGAQGPDQPKHREDDNEGYARCDGAELRFAVRHRRVSPSSLSGSVLRSPSPDWIAPLRPDVDDAKAFPELGEPVQQNAVHRERETRP
jgi:hypothetical protein